MKALWLAFSFIRIPRLFASLLLWPLVVGALVACGQILLSTVYLGLANETPTDFQDRIMAETASEVWLRKRTLGSAEPLPSPLVCRWIMRAGTEIPPSDECKPNTLDIAIQTGNPDTFDTSSYESFFDGSTRAIHVCQNCRTAITVENADGEKRSSDLTSISALGVYMLAASASQRGINTHLVEARQSAEELENLSGTIHLRSKRFRGTINITDSSQVMVLILNTALILLITVWLALRGHRKVLDYFAHNNALLPLVAACGKHTFYTALWIITLLRVAFFLIACIPATYILYIHAVPEETLVAFTGDSSSFILWVAGVLSSLSAITIIASIAELKHRESWANVVYKYIPMFVWTIGTVIWVVVIALGPEHSRILQDIISAVPVFGFSPMVLSPVIKLSSHALAAHAVIASAIVLVVLRQNSRWFAAHLEEL